MHAPQKHLASITQLLERCRTSRQIFLALDRDGTLVPYAKEPSAAIMPPQVASLLRDLAQLPNIVLAIVSARGLNLLKQDIDTTAIVLAGNYGMEIRLTNMEDIVAEGAQKAAPELEKLAGELADIMRNFPGSILENHVFSLCLHWHAVAPNRLADLHATLDKIGSRSGSLAMRRLPTSYEFLPGMHWDKSFALETIASRLLSSPHESLLIYIGDSEQDEPAFEWVNARGGFSIKVGSADNSTKATLRMPQPVDVVLFLEQLLREGSIFAQVAYDADDDPAEREKRIEAVFSALKDDYAGGLLKRIEELESVVEAARNKADDLGTLTDARMQVHRMKGTIGSYGFSEISSTLGEIENCLEQIEKAHAGSENIVATWEKDFPSIAKQFSKARAAVKREAPP